MAKILNLIDPKMLERIQAPVNPLHRTLNTLDSDMHSILRRSDMTDEEKVQAYNQILHRYLEYQRTDKKPVSSTIEENKPYFDVEKDVMRTIPKSMKRKAEALLERIKDGLDTSWNERGEFVYKGRTIAGTNMVDLVNDMLRQRKGFEPYGRFEFARALRHSNVPQDLVGNRRMWGWMHRDSATSDAFSTADESLREDGDESLHRSRSVSKTPATQRSRRIKSLKKTKVKHRINWESPK